MKALAVVGAITLICAYTVLEFLVMLPSTSIKSGWLMLGWLLGLCTLQFLAYGAGMLVERNQRDKEKK